MALKAAVLKHQFFNTDGSPLSGGKLYSYIAGTTTPKATYKDKIASEFNTNPIILDSRGECDIWLHTGSYKFVLKDSADSIIWTEDNIQSLADALNTQGALAVLNNLSDVADAPTALANLGGVPKSTLTTKGDLFVASGPTAVVRQSVGSDNTVLIADSSQTNGVRWGLASGLSNLSVVAKTTTYSIVTTDDVVKTDASGGSFTVTLPTAVGNSGKTFQIIRTDQTLANAVTIATTASQTINGAATRKLMTQYEQFTVISDGSNWVVRDHTYFGGNISYTPTGGWTTNATYSGFWKRVANGIVLDAKISLSGAPTGNLTIDLPSGLTINTSSILTTNTGVVPFGFGVAQTAIVGANYLLLVKYYSTTSVGCYYQQANSGNSYNVLMGLSNGSSPFSFAANGLVHITTTPIPITDWEG
jgi:hypothetical protein